MEEYTVYQAVLDGAIFVFSIGLQAFIVALGVMSGMMWYERIKRKRGESNFESKEKMPSSTSFFWGLFKKDTFKN